MTPKPVLNSAATRMGQIIITLGLLVAAALASGQSADHQAVLDARDALRKNDAKALAQAVAATTQDELAQWVQYWELSNRLNDATVAEVEAFYARWPGSYVEDRLRNDWLLVLGKRRDWENFSRDYPRFRMDDDREVTCYALYTRFLQGQNVREEASQAWFAQRDLDDGCNLLAGSLVSAGKFDDTVVWHKARLAIEANRITAARAAAGMLNADASTAVASLSTDPVRALKRTRTPLDRQSAELATLALMRLASKDVDAAVAQMKSRWAKDLPAPLASFAWATIGKQAALQLQTQSSDYYALAKKAWQRSTPAQRAAVPWSDDMLTWQARAALRLDVPDAKRWARVNDAIDDLPAAQQQDPTWVYWRARALDATAWSGNDAASERQVAQRMMQSIADQMSFYGRLASEELGSSVHLPAAPRPITDAEREAAHANPGLQRALLLIDIGLRSEGVREWNFTLRGMNDRQLLAAADWACERKVWDRCINTSERTRDSVDMAQRFPTPYRKQVVEQAAETGVDPAFVYGLIRQESRFITDVRSSAGASGLMQLMPATARWTAKKIGASYSHHQITDRDMNLKLGMAYLKLLLDDFENSMTMATAAYNAGPGRPRRWREGPTLEAAVWAENIPFGETRDYVKKVLSNTVYYSVVLHGQVPALKSKLGAAIGPRTEQSAPPDGRLP